jgi:deoxyribodipyrimidine photo-lyase
MLRYGGPVTPSPPFPALRLRVANDRPLNADGHYVLYWMTSARRPGWNHALDRALAWARELGKPLLVFEGLRAGYQWAADRHHAYVLAGMAANAAAFAGTSARYYPYVEPTPRAGRGLLTSLAGLAAVVVGDDYPAFFLPRMLAAAARQVPVRLELVDGNGLLPMAAAPTAAPTAYVFRRLLQRELPAHLLAAPDADPFAADDLPRWPAGREVTNPAAAAARAWVGHLGHDPAWVDRLPSGFAERWPPATPEMLAGSPSALAALPIDHAIAPVAETGGHVAGTAILRRFVDERLAGYGGRNEPESGVTSELSAYLHYGHVAAHQVFAAVAEREGWTLGRAGDHATGARAGWWGMSTAAEAFLDQLVTWREVAFNTCAHLPDYDRYDSLPAWARRSLDAHAADPRPDLYSLAELDAARTHDPLWNAAQRQLQREGRIHNYLRMLWGKKVLQWSPSPEEAWNRLVELNNRYSIDGRDPNSYAGIAWCLGRYDRPWAPQRPIFGVIRTMSSENTARKVRVKGYLARYGPLG